MNDQNREYRGLPVQLKCTKIRIFKRLSCHDVDSHLDVVDEGEESVFLISFFYVIVETLLLHGEWRLQSQIFFLELNKIKFYLLKG